MSPKWPVFLGLTLFCPGGGGNSSPLDIKIKFTVENSASNIPETTWLFVFWPNGNLADIFIFIRLDLRDSFERSLLDENGYRILTFSAKFQTYLTYFQVNILQPKVLGIVYIYTSEPTT